jgi:heme-degrading monooxygenase HmoA
VAVPKPPYYAVIFTSRLREPAIGYETTGDQMLELARKQPGYLGFDSARGADGLGVTVSYWESLAAIKNWKAVAEHREAQAKGRGEWYSEFHVRVAKVEKEYSFSGQTT